MSKHRGLSGKNGRVQSCIIDGTAVKANKTGHSSSVPSSSFKLKICALRIPEKQFFAQLIKMINYVAVLFWMDTVTESL